MKAIPILLFTLIALVFNSGQAQVLVFNQQFSQVASRGIVPGVDGGYVVAGNRGYFDQAIKVDDSGSIIWRLLTCMAEFCSSRPTQKIISALI